MISKDQQEAAAELRAALGHWNVKRREEEIGRERMAAAVAAAVELGLGERELERMTGLSRQTIRRMSGKHVPDYRYPRPKAPRQTR